MDPDPRLDGPAQAFNRLSAIADQCLDEGKKRWTTALDQQAAILAALGERGVTVAKTPPPSKPPSAAPKEPTDGSQLAG